MIRRRPLRDQLRRNDLALKFMAAASGKAVPERLLNNLPPKQVRATPRKLEAPILKAALSALRADPRVAFADRRNSGAIHGEGVHIFLGKAGTLDISGMLKGGIYFEVEIKAPGKKPSSDQINRIALIQSHGGRAGWATSPEEALMVLGGG